MTSNTKVVVYRVDNGQPFIAEAVLVSNSDGSVSFHLPNGTYAGQEPTAYGVRHDGPATQQYQRALATGNSVTFLPHPDYPAYTYLLGSGKVFPA